MYDEHFYKSKWRLICQQRSIDPQEGATGYQVALYLSDPIPLADDNWWQDRNLWKSPGSAHSSTESEALSNILRDCAIPHVQDFDMRQILADVFWGVRETLRIERQDIPLRDILRRQGKTLQYIELNAKTRQGVNIIVDLEE